MATPPESTAVLAKARRNVPVVLAPTLLEYWAVRCLRPPARVLKTGVGMRDRHAGGDALTVVCGLAGGLVPELAPGTVVIPDLVGAEDGTVRRSDDALRRALVAGSRHLGFNPETGPLLTAASLVTGARRREWALRGYVAADMESALVAHGTGRFAVIRVVLDGPSHSISDRWLTPRQAIADRSLWPELLWLSHAAPHYALRAARVLREGLLQFLRDA